MITGNFKRVIATILMMAMLNLFAACSSEQPGTTNSPVETETVASTAVSDAAPIEPRTVALPTGAVILKTFERNQNDGSLTVRYDWTSAENELHNRKMIADKTVSGDVYKWESRVEDPSGTLMWYTSVTMNSQDTTRYEVLEMTYRDTLLIRVHVDDGYVTERYTYNGDSYTVKRPIPAEGETGYALGEPPIGDMPQQLADETLMFKGLENLFPPNCSLFDNDDSFLMLELLESEEFQDWVGTQSDSKELSPEVMDLWRLAEIGLFKCFLGGPMNFLCVASVGIYAACALSWIIDMII